MPFRMMSFHDFNFWLRRKTTHNPNNNITRQRAVYIATWLQQGSCEIETSLTLRFFVKICYLVTNNKVKIKFKYHMQLKVNKKKLATF